MFKRLIIVIILSVFCFGFTVQDAHKKVIARMNAAAATCQVDYAPSLTGDVGDNVNRYTTVDFTGFIYTPDSNEEVCGLDFFMHTEEGEISGITYYCQIWTLDVSDQLDTLLGVSAGISGLDSAGNAQWFSATTGGMCLFASSVSLTSGVDYGLVVTRASGDSNPTTDETNYMKLGHDSENNLVDGIMGDRVIWAWVDGGPHTITDQVADDDRLIKVYRMQTP